MALNGEIKETFYEKFWNLKNYIFNVAWKTGSHFQKILSASQLEKTVSLEQLKKESF